MGSLRYPMEEVFFFWSEEARRLIYSFYIASSWDRTTAIPRLRTLPPQIAELRGYGVEQGFTPGRCGLGRACAEPRQGKPTTLIFLRKQYTMVPGVRSASGLLVTKIASKITKFRAASY